LKLIGHLDTGLTREKINTGKGVWSIVFAAFT